MKTITYLLMPLLLLVTFFQSCEDLEEVQEPDFNISVVSKNLKVGEPIEFQIKNAPNFLLFYPGEFGYEYKHRNRTNAEGAVKMSFKNAQKWGLKQNKTGTLSVWASTDYDGSGTPEAVASASWTDISDRFTISEAYTYDWTESGDADIADLTDGEPVYIAFKFFAMEHAGTGHRQPEWRLDDFKIELFAAGAPGPLNVANDNTPGFTQVNVQGDKTKLGSDKWRSEWFPYAGQWRIVGGSNPNEDWLISKPINLTKVNPDKGMPLKTFSEKLESFTHTYDKPGTYTVTFIGNNETIYGKKETIKEFTITIK
ncbi:MAG: DUF5017 domain-containing protein [Marinifilum sp.]|jgi:hypothetical protein|nr:DUF5017 domain-containing protein [Marinifilum sp.]